MKGDAIRPAYKNLLLVTGVLLVTLGIGNWVVGSVRTRPYAQFLESNPGPAKAAGSFKADLLERPDDQREERIVSRAKLEFYELVRSGGRLMVTLGAFCLLAAILGLGTSGRRTLPPFRPSNRPISR